MICPLIISLACVVHTWTALIICYVRLSDEQVSPFKHCRTSYLAMQLPAAKGAENEYVSDSSAVKLRNGQDKRCSAFLSRVDLANTSIREVTALLPPSPTDRSTSPSHVRRSSYNVYTSKHSRCLPAFLYSSFRH